MKKKRSRVANKFSAVHELHTVKTNVQEVSLSWQFDEGEDDFEDVTFQVMNCDDPAAARNRIADFIDMLFRELTARQESGT